MFDQIRYGIEQAALWAAGKGAISFAIALTLGAANPMVAFVALPLGAFLSLSLVAKKHRHTEKQLRTEYGKEVGTLLGVDPERLTQRQFELVAEGNAQLGLPGNPVLKEALRRNDFERNAAMLTRIGAGLLTLGTVAAINQGVFDEIQQLLNTTVNPAIKGIATLSGALLAAGSLNTLLNFSFDHIIRDLSEGHRKTTADLIAAIDHEISRGNAISLEQVFGVMVSANRDLDRQITHTYGEDYPHLPARLQYEALNRFGDVRAISQLAQDISNRQVRPQELAFIAAGQASGVERLTEPPKEEESRRLIRRVPLPFRGSAMLVTEIKDRQSGLSEAMTHAPIAQPERSFVERYASEGAKAGFANQETARREQKAEQDLTTQRA